METTSSEPVNGGTDDRAHLQRTIIRSYYLAFDLWELSRQEGFVIADQTRATGDVLLRLARELSKKMLKGGLYSEESS